MKVMPVASRYYETALLMKALAFNRTLKPGRQAFVNTKLVSGKLYQGKLRTSNNKNISTSCFHS